MWTLAICSLRPLAKSVHNGWWMEIKTKPFHWHLYYGVTLQLCWWANEACARYECPQQADFHRCSCNIGPFWWSHPDTRLVHDTEENSVLQGHKLCQGHKHSCQQATTIFQIFKCWKFGWKIHQSIVSCNCFIVFSSTLLWRFFAALLSSWVFASEKRRPSSLKAS